MKFTHIDDLKRELEKRGFQSYNLNIGLENFEENLISTDNENPRTAPFEWLDENDNDIKIDITIIASDILDDDGEIEEISYTYEI